MSTSTMPLSTTQPAANAQPISLHLTRTLRATPERVFNAWTQPALLRQWFGPAGFQCYEATADLTAGGNYAIGMRAAPPPTRPSLASWTAASRAPISRSCPTPSSSSPTVAAGGPRPSRPPSRSASRRSRAAPCSNSPRPASSIKRVQTGHNIGWNSSLSKLEALLNRP